MNEWISVKEKMPEVGKFGCSENVFILIATTDCCDSRNEIEITPSVGFYDEVSGWAILDPLNDCGNAVNSFDAVTHWMPIPSSPEGITEGDIDELCRWHQLGEPETDEPIGVFVRRQEAKIANDIEDEIPIATIVSELPPEVGKALKEAMSPEAVKRGNEFAIDEQSFKDRFVYLPPEYVRFLNPDYRHKGTKFTLLEGYSKKTIDELFSIGLSWQRENGDCGTFTLFPSRTRIIRLEDGTTEYDVFEISDSVCVSKDGETMKYNLYAGIYE